MGDEQFQIRSNCLFADNIFEGYGDPYFRIYALPSYPISSVFERDIFSLSGWPGWMELDGVSDQNVAFRSNTMLCVRSIWNGSAGATAVTMVNNILDGYGCWTDLLCSGSIAWDIQYNCFGRRSDLHSCPLGEGNIFADPLFCDPGQGDFTLDASSPCIGAVLGGETMGAFGIGCGVTSVAVDASPRRRLGLAVHPNPVLAGAEFTFDPSGRPRQLEIYDAQARLVERFVGAAAPVSWAPGREARAGVYFARLKGAGVSEVAKFVVVR